ncbi:hypothetical protein AVEN_214641-1 [Araneus ventricosus]|uniref:Endonuclease/exonuclease/phosphatase domain-containing protein n=1 Tax=Araneus ventricosus TaxID=182803 RepID=A0A4Y2LBB8_ARAVE|nr:hypothetical protein AVEN_214641-1 [Araneus ventricosus]
MHEMRREIIGPGIVPNLQELLQLAGIHCKGNHTSNYSGCPPNPPNWKSFPTAPFNAWSDLAALAKVKETPKSDSNLKPVTQWNAGGIKPIYNQFKYLAQEWKPNVIAIQKTHLNPKDKLKLVNYTTCRTDRLTHRGGGTALVIRNSIDHYPTPIASDSFENPTIAIILPNSQQITVSNIYRPPRGSISTDERNRIFSSNNKCIAVGDFNAKHSAWSLGRRNHNGNIINDYICNNNLILLAPPEPPPPTSRTIATIQARLTLVYSRTSPRVIQLP